MKEILDIIKAYNDAISKIYTEEELTNLNGLKNESGLMKLYYDTLAKYPNKTSKDFDYSKNYEDIDYLSSQLLYFTATLYLHKPYIVNPLKAGFTSGSSKFFPYYDTLPSRRYDMFANITCQIVYNYWSRIAELINSFLPNRIESKYKINFKNVIEKIPGDIKSKSENFNWFSNFIKNDYSELNKKRKQNVHHTTETTEYRFQHIENVKNSDKLSELQTEKENIPEYYKKHINLTIEGFKKTLLLIEEINN